LVWFVSTWKIADLEESIAGSVFYSVFLEDQVCVSYCFWPALAFTLNDSESFVCVLTEVLFYNWSPAFYLPSYWAFKWLVEETTVLGLSTTGEACTRFGALIKVSCCSNLLAIAYADNAKRVLRAKVLARIAVQRRIRLSFSV
jgi:hypothetical protein